MSRSVNLVVLIGNLTRDPEMRYTPKGSAVTSFGIATNRSWTTDEGERKEVADFHNIVAWGRLGEICNQYLRKGRKVYIKGRLTSSSWEDNEGNKKSRVEVTAEDMIIMDSKRVEDFGGEVAPEGGRGAANSSGEDISPEAVSAGVASTEASQNSDDKEGEATPF